MPTTHALLTLLITAAQALAFATPAQNPAPPLFPVRPPTPAPCELAWTEWRAKPYGDRVPAPAKLVLPPGVEVLYVLCGQAEEHLGICSARVGDLDHDGVEDFVLGGLTAAYFRYGPGGARAYSSRTGRILWEVHGSQRGFRENRGDGFGNALARVSDVDGDGTDDVAIGAFGWADSGCVQICSGADGHSIALIGSWSTVPGAAVVRGADLATHAPLASSKSEFGAALAVCGDLDADGVGDLLIGAGWTDEWSDTWWIVSSRTLNPLATLRGTAIVETDAAASSRGAVWVRSNDAGPDGRPIPEVTRAPSAAKASEPRFAVPARIEQRERPAVYLGDVNGDGRVEWLVTEYEFACRGRAWVFSVARADAPK